MKRYLWMVILFMVTGCFPTYPNAFVKPNVTQEEYKNDIWECVNIARVTCNPQDYTLRQKVTMECMENRGYAIGPEYRQAVMTAWEKDEPYKAQGYKGGK